MKISDRHPMGAGFFMLSWKFVKEKWIILEKLDNHVFLW